MTDPLAEVVRERRRRNLPRPVPRRLTLQITNLCNSRCTMCSIWEIYRRDKERYRTELTGSQWLRVAELALAHGVGSIDVTGGEPFLKEGVTDLLSLVLRSTGFTAVTTNALQPERIAGMVREVAEHAPRDALFVVSVSLDGFAETYAKLRGVSDGYDRAVSLLRQLRQMKESLPQVNPQISFTIMDDNVDEMADLMAEALRTGLIAQPDEFTFRPVASGPYYGTENAVRFQDRVIAAVRELQQRYTFLRTRPFIERIPESVLEPKRMLLPCYAMFASCWIDPYGNVAPCVTMTDQVVGNVRDFDLDLLPVWTGAAAQGSRERIAKDDCAVCWTDCQAIENLVYATS